MCRHAHPSTENNFKGAGSPFPWVKGSHCLSHAAIRSRLVGQQDSRGSPMSTSPDKCQDDGCVSPHLVFMWVLGTKLRSD